MIQTSEQYQHIVQGCREIFLKKTIDYGTSWRIARASSLTDQIFIKALRIRTIQDLKTQKVGDDIPSEFKGIINYAIIGLVQLELTDEDEEELVPYGYSYTATSVDNGINFQLDRVNPHNGSRPHEASNLAPLLRAFISMKL